MATGDYLKCPACRNTNFCVQFTPKGLSIQCKNIFRNGVNMRMCEWEYESGRWNRYPSELNAELKDSGFYLEEDDK